ncbi:MULTISPECIES: hypothetical protein [Streptomyces]|nr:MULTISPECIES: hypothetical protein [Streptomyces]MCQ9706133.1 hypothetical protein [Streptomyces sp. BSP1]
MRTMREVWVFAALAAAVAVLVGCGGGSDKADAKPSKESAPTATPEELDTAEPKETEPEYPPGPEGAIDEKADIEGWEYGSAYDSAPDYVQDICDSLPKQDASSPAQWLAESGNMEGDDGKILTFGMPKLCPEWSKTVKAAVSGTYERWISLGEFDVKAHPKLGDDVQEIGPGTYQAKGKFSGCYWERTTLSGDIIANQFVSQARVLTVTLRAGELFKNGCGTFKPVG